MKFTKNLLVLSIAASLAACGGGSDSNDAPQFSSSNYNFSVAEDNAYSGSVSATDSDTVTYTVASAANNGIFALEADGTFTYTPRANFYGEDTVTVQASDGSKTSQADITFTVNNENDAPVLVSTDVTVTTLDTFEGQINVEDVDGDDISFSLVAQPEAGEVELVEATGAFTYTAEQGKPVAGSFKVTFTDGNVETPVEAEIHLTPSYVTNEDKLNYYYSSEHSHLKQAEAILDDINDDASKDEINGYIAEGYSFAGFFDQAESLLQGINRVDSRSKAYRTIGDNIAKAGNTEKAEIYFKQAEIDLNQYISDKGLQNLTSSDAGMLLGLVNDYIDAGLILEAQNLLNVTKVYADTVHDEEYNTQYGNFLTAFNRNADAFVQIYSANKTPENYQRALDAVNEYAELAANTGYRLETRGTYQGQPSNRVTALQTAWAAEIFYNIGAIEEAKKYTNLVLSLYGITGIDSNYNYPVSEYAEVTKETYRYPLIVLSGLIEGLYPNLDDNPALALLHTEREIANAKEASFAAQMVNDIIAGKSVDEATQPAYDYFIPKGQYSNLYYSMVEYRGTDPRGAALLYIQGYEAEALALLEKASSLLTSEEYVDNNRYISDITGSRGCARLTELTKQYGSDALKQAKKCETLVDNYLTTDAGKKTTENSIEAYKNLMQTFNIAGDQDGIQRAGTKVLNELELLDEKDASAESHLLIANFLLRYGFESEAIPLVLKSLDDYKAFIEDGVSESDLTDVVKDIKSNILGNNLAGTGFNEHYSTLKAYRAGAAKIDNFATAYQNLKQRLVTEVAYYTNKVLSLSEKSIQDNIEHLIEMNFAVGNITTVEALIANDVNSEANRLELTKLYSELLATKNDFPSSIVASVDTDEDGLPNFFLSSATPEQIEASGLQKDNDADNDGIADEQDVAPLTPNN